MVRVNTPLLLTAISSCTFGKVLPIHIEDNHSGSFAHFATTLDLDQAHTLVLIDAHSDASSIEQSDRIRHQLRHVSSLEKRSQLIKKWRFDGTIQPHNWIEPLMPRPFSKVIWIAGETLTKQEIAHLQKETHTHLDWKTQVTPRACGSLAPHWQVTDWSRFKKTKLNAPIALSIDLDYYARDGISQSSLITHWKHFLHQEKLQTVTFALSRPWLRNDHEAHRLLEQALRIATSVKNSQITFDPYRQDPIDRSEKAVSLMKAGQLPPRYPLSQAPESLRNLILEHHRRFHIPSKQELWDRQIASWKSQHSGHTLELPGQQADLDGVIRIHRRQLDDIRLTSNLACRKVRWWLHEPSHSSYNLLPNLVKGRTFTGPASSYIQTKRRLIATTPDPILSRQSWTAHLPVPHTAGTFRIQAELITNEDTTLTPVLEIRVREKEGFLGSLSEQLGTPYVFGIGKLHLDGESGPETLLGSDCANFLIYAWRKNGHLLPWCNPDQLKSHLQPLSPQNHTHSKTSRPHFDTGLISSGLVIHAGNHVAILWKDLGQPGILEPQDLIIHHLGGFPEIIPLSVFLTKHPSYQLYHLPVHETIATLAFGGDVNLATSRGQKPSLPETIIRQLQQADHAWINLECSLPGTSPKNKPHVFHFEPQTLETLTHWGIDSVGLANNHSGDGGPKALRKLHTLLQKKHIAITSSGNTLGEATRIHTIHFKSSAVSLLPVNMIGPGHLPATETTPGCLCLPEHQTEILKLLTAPRPSNHRLIVLPHWGREFTGTLSTAQRESAKWFIRNGADAIIGAHPHVVQSLQYYRGKPVHFSLGNLYFPYPGPPGSNTPHLLVLGIDRHGSLKIQ